MKNIHKLLLCTIVTGTLSACGGGGGGGSSSGGATTGESTQLTLLSANSSR